VNAVNQDRNTVHQAGAEALRTIGALFEPGDVIEIRALDVARTSDHAGNTRAGYFNFENNSAITAAIRSLDGNAEGVYVVLNRFNPDLLARSNNRLRVRPKHTTSDADITELRWLYIDADAIRPAGISATDTEHDAALQRIVTIREFLAGYGWPEPIQGDSGNGGHLLYRLPELEVKTGAELIKRCLQALSARFSDHLVKIDESTTNPARLCKLYGTLTRKGDATPERPHRRSALLEVPERIDAVRVEMLEALAYEALSASAPTSIIHREIPTHRSFDIDQWLASSGLELVKGPEPYSGGRRWTLRVCPFNREHAKPVVIELAGGALVYRCLHRSCEGNDWTALRGLIDPTHPGGAMIQSINSTAAAPEGITDLSQLPSVWTLSATMTWCVEDMIAQGSVTLICSESGTGKTWLGYYIAGCVAHGAPVAGRRAERSKVLYVDGENPLYTVKQRLASLGIRETNDLMIWGGWNPWPPQGPQSQLIIDFARRHKSLIIFDSLIEFHPGSEQSSTETRAFMRYFRALANLGATVIVLHHSGKAETAKIYRGSSDIKAAVDTAYQLESVNKESNRLGQLSLKCFKGRLVPGQNFGLEFREGEGFIACNVPTRTKTVESVIDDILKSHPGSNQKMIVQLGQAQGCSKKQLEHSLKTGYWQTERGPHNSILYRLPGQDERCEEAEN